MTTDILQTFKLKRWRSHSYQQ